MKDKPNEWVSVADLMSGVMAIVMLLLVISVLHKSFQKIITADKLAQQEMIKDLLNETKDQFNIRGLGQAVIVDLPGNKITLK